MTAARTLARLARKLERFGRSGRKAPAPGAPGRETPESPRSSDVPIYAGMASIPSRTEMLERAVASVYGQVDRLFVHLNGFTEIPQFLNLEKITVSTSAELGDIKDSGKFYGLTQVSSGIYLSLDDDIEYPPDYARVMAKYVARFRNKCVVGVHGAVFPTLAHSFFDRKLIHFEKGWDATVPVSLLGTGTTAFSIADTGIRFELFRQHGMADVSLALFLKERGIPALVVRRKAGWLRALSADDEASLYGHTRRNPAAHTEAIVRARPWGFAELAARADRAGITGLLPGRWQAVAAAQRNDPDAAALLAKHSLPSLCELLRTVLNAAELWTVVKAYLPSGEHDARFHCRLIRDCTSCHPEEALRLCTSLYSHYRGRQMPEAMLHYAAAAIAACGTLAMYDEADALYADVEAHCTPSPDVTMEYMRLKSQQGDHQRVLELARARFEELRPRADFAPLVYGVAAQANGPISALHGLLPSFMRQGRRAARERRSIILACARAPRRTADESLPLEVVVTEDAVLGKRMAGCARDLVLLYCALGMKARARRFLERGAPLLEAEHGAAALSLLRALAAANAAEVLHHLNAYNARHGLAPLEAHAPATGRGGFFAGLAGAPTAAAPRNWGTVSVIMATYNARETVGYAVRSVLEQSYRNLELIAVDDASTDGTWEELQKLRNADPRLICLRNPTNAGPYACRNIALALASGDFVANQDADDFSHPQRLERQLDALHRTGAMAVIAAHVRLEASGIVALENHGDIVGDGPTTLLCRRGVFADIGEFAPVRTRGDIEFRDRLRCYYGSHMLAQLEEVLVYALHDARSNSHTAVESAEGKRRLARFRAAYNRRLLSMRDPEELRPRRTEHAARATL